MDVADAGGVFAGFELGEQRRALAVGGQHRVDQARLSARRVLGDMTQAPAAEQAHVAAIRRQLARQETQQGRLAGAVRPDQPDTPALVHGQGRVVEEHTPAVAKDEVVDVKHVSYAGIEAAGLGARL